MKMLGAVVLVAGMSGENEKPYSVVFRIRQGILACLKRNMTFLFGM